MERVVALHVAGQPASKIVLALTALEDQVFSTLKAAAATFTPSTTIRVAGGWVRDKLLGRDSHDIDIALDDITGREFAEHVNAYQVSVGLRTSSIGVIAANPDQSKHLETATMRVQDFWIDFVNLRAEEYDADSRIPRTTFGTPLQVSARRVKPVHEPYGVASYKASKLSGNTALTSPARSRRIPPILLPPSPPRQCLQDAERRDFTINSLFYNVTTDAVEDFTGRGVNDLTSGTLRTPLPPRTTFLDDPLRVLRALRFASRFGFTMEPALVAAATDPDVRLALALKVSRERVGREFESMLSGGRPVASLRVLDACGLTDVVFAVPPGLSGISGEVLDPTGACGGNTSVVDGSTVVTPGVETAAASVPEAAAALPPSVLPPGWTLAGTRIVESVHYLFIALGSPSRLGDPAAIAGMQVPSAPEIGFCARFLSPVAVEALPDVSERVPGGFDSDQRRALLTAAALHPLANLRHTRKARQEPLHFAVACEGMKRKHTEGEDVTAILDGALGFGALIEHGALQPLPLGLLLRNVTKYHWQAALYLSAASSVAPLLFGREAASAAASGAGTVPEALAQEVRRRLCAHASAAKAISEWKLDNAWALKPLLNGKQVIGLLGLKGGPEIGSYVEGLVRWQLLNPSATAADAEGYLKQLQALGGSGLLPGTPSTGGLSSVLAAIAPHR